MGNGLNHQDTKTPRLRRAERTDGNYQRREFSRSIEMIRYRLFRDPISSSQFTLRHLGVFVSWWFNSAVPICVHPRSSAVSTQFGLSVLCVSAVYSPLNVRSRARAAAGERPPALRGTVAPG